MKSMKSQEERKNSEMVKTEERENSSNQLDGMTEMKP